MRFVFVAALAIGLAACSSKPADTGTQPQVQQGTPAAAPAAGVKKYDLKGKVVAINKEAKKVQIDGEDIPGFMMAMTMAYPVKDEHQLDGLSPGDRITAKVVSDKEDYWLENIAKVK